METKLTDLVDRLIKDIQGIPWKDKGIAPAQLHKGVEFFIAVFQTEAKNIIKEEKENAKEKND